MPPITDQVENKHSYNYGYHCGTTASGRHCMWDLGAQFSMKFGLKAFLHITGGIDVINVYTTQVSISVKFLINAVSKSQYKSSLLPSALTVLSLLKLLSEEPHSQPEYYHHQPVTQAHLLSQSVMKS